MFREALQVVGLLDSFLHTSPSSKMTIPADSWSSIARSKQERNLALIPAEWRIQVPDTVHLMDVPAKCGVLSEAELAITNTSAPDLAAKLQTRELKAYDVVLAFAKRAAVAHQLVCRCNVER